MTNQFPRLRVAILDDYQDVVHTLDCFSTLQGHDVTVWNDAVAGCRRAGGATGRCRRAGAAARTDQDGRSSGQPPAEPQADQPERARAAHRSRRMHAPRRDCLLGTDAAPVLPDGGVHLGSDPGGDAQHPARKRGAAPRLCGKARSGSDCAVARSGFMALASSVRWLLGSASHSAWNCWFGGDRGLGIGRGKKGFKVASSKQAFYSPNQTCSACILRLNAETAGPDWPPKSLPS